MNVNEKGHYREIEMTRTWAKRVNEGRRKKAAEKRITLMDFAEGRAHILPREEVIERLLARPKP